MNLSARNIVLDTPTRRDDDRTPVGRTCILRVASRPPVVSELLDLTRFGCRIKTRQALAAEELVQLGIAGVGGIEARVVWHGEEGYGCEFLTPLRAGAVSAATQENVVSLDVAPVAVPFKWPIRYRALFLVAYAVAPWLAVGAIGYAAMHAFG